MSNTIADRNAAINHEFNNAHLAIVAVEHNIKKLIDAQALRRGENRKMELYKEALKNLRTAQTYLARSGSAINCTVYVQE